MKWARGSMRAALRAAWLGVLGVGCLIAPTVAAQPGAPAPAAAQPSAPAGSARRPNIVVILADDLGFTDIGSFGSEIRTPHLDALAQRGVRFSNFHVSASCSPTRAMFLTGVDNHRNGVGNMRETIPRQHLGQPGYLTVLNQSVVAFPSLLQEAGYRTYVAGKWHVGKEPHNLPPARGFERSIVQGDSGSDNWNTRQRYLELTDKVYWYADGREVTLPEDYYSSQYFVDRMIEFLETGRGSGKPFLAYVPFQANHIPLQAPREFIERYRGRYDQGWSVLRRERRDRAAAAGVVPAGAPMVTESTTLDWGSLPPEERRYQARRMEVYAAMAEAMDHHIGRLVDYLKRAGEYDNTIFVFFSDNGAEASDPYAVPLGAWWLDRHYRRDIDALGAKGAYSIIGPSWASAAASPLSTYKFYSGEGGIRVPLIVAGVPGERAGRVVSAFSHVTDLAPTLLELAGVPPPQGQHQGRSVERMVGRSLLPTITGASERVYPADQAVGYELSGNQALFKGDLKLIRNIPPVGDGRWHLYDIVRDPGETRDLAPDMPEVFAQMQRDYAAWAQANGVLPMPEGYEPTRQVLVNALLNVYVPRLGRWAAIALPVLLLGVWAWRRYRRRPA